MGSRKILVIFLILIVVIVAFLIFFPKSKNNKPAISSPSITPTVEEQIENKFNGLVIPDDTEKFELKNVSGEEGMGVATKTQIYADLPELNKGENYQVVLSNGTKTILLGSLKQSKGGWILEYDLSKYSGYDQIAVIKGTKHILEGTFDID